MWFVHVMAAVEVLQESSQCTPKSKQLSLGLYAVGSHFLKLIAKCQNWFTKTHGQTVKTMNTTQGPYASFSTTKILSSSIASQTLPRRYNSTQWTMLKHLIMKVWVLCHLSLSLLLCTVFAKYFSWNRILPLIRETYIYIYSPQNISALQYSLV